MVTVTSDDVGAQVQGATFASMFLGAIREVPARVALRGPGGASYTYADYGDRVARLAAGLLAAGVTRGERVILMIRNIPEFHFVDTAVTMCGATPVSLYNSSSPEQIAYLANHCEAKIAIVEDAFVERVRAAQRDGALLRALGTLGSGGDFLIADLWSGDALDLEAAAAAISPADLATVIYTSGTTGPPKGVMLTQRNVAFTVQMVRQASAATGLDVDGMRTVSYLPMAHIAERLTTHYGGVGGRYDVTCLADMNQLAATLREARPELFVGVPRVWEKLHAGLMVGIGADPARLERFEAGVAAASPLVRRQALGQLNEAEEATLAHLDSVGFAPVRAMLGLDAVRIAITSAAPIALDLVVWFRAIGVPLTEIWGMSETSGPATWEPGRHKPGTVGRALPGCEVRLADDGELLCRGGNIFAGYLNAPERTAEVFDAEGWLHTGDIATVDDEGYVHIVDRKREILITSGGKNISPANLETSLKSVPLVGQVCVVGDARPYVAALLVLDPDQALAFATRQQLGVATLAEIAAHPRVLEVIGAGVEAAMEPFNQAERVKRWVVLGVDWLPDSDELTPTSKLKRRNIVTKYAAEVASLYE